MNKILVLIALALICVAIWILFGKLADYLIAKLTRWIKRRREGSGNG